MTKDEALRMALEYLEESDNYLGSIDHSEPIAAIKQVLAQPEERYTYGTPLLDVFTTPPAAQRQWVGLIRGVRVEGDSVVITVKGGNDAARELCGALLEEKNT